MRVSRLKGKDLFPRMFTAISNFSKAFKPTRGCVDSKGTTYDPARLLTDDTTFFSRRHRLMETALHFVDGQGVTGLYVEKRIGMSSVKEPIRSWSKVLRACVHAYAHVTLMHLRSV